MRKFIYILILVFSIIRHEAHSLEDFADNDSCASSVSILMRIVNNIASLGLFSAYSGQFNMRDEEDSRCSVPTNNVKFRYKYLAFDEKKVMTTKTDHRTWRDGDSGWWVLPPAKARAKYSGDKLCIQFLTAFGYQTIGCKYRPDPSFHCPGHRDPVYGCRSVTPRMENGCYAGVSCATNADRKSRSLLPISSTVVECVKESLYRVFVDQTPCGYSSQTRINLFPAFQDSLRNIVRIALTLYVIIFGIKTVMGSDVPRKGEVFLFFFKFIMVTYFSIGIIETTDSNGNTQNRDGITTFIEPAFDKATSSLVHLVYNASGSRGLCQYHNDDYPKNYGYLAVFDALDCRIFHYLGIDVNKSSGQLLQVAVFSMIMPAFLSFQIIFMIMCIMFSFFLLSVVVFFTHFYLLALIVQQILIYFAPLFIPFALFGLTKGYFNGWLKLLISFTLQPMIVMAFIGLMITIFDQVIYENCEFNRYTVNISGKELPAFQLKLPATKQQKCKDSWGWQFEGLKGKLTNNVPAVFYNIVQLRFEVYAKLFFGLMTLVLFGALFYGFSSVVADIAADISGGPSLSMMTIKPMEIFDRAVNLAKAAVKYLAGDYKGASEDATKAAVGEENMAKIRDSVDSGAKISSGGDSKGSGAKILSGSDNKGSGAKILSGSDNKGSGAKINIDFKG